MRKLYIHPEETLEIHIIHDADASLTHREWQNQLRPRRMILTIKDSDHIAFVDPAMKIEQTSCSGLTLRYR